MRRKRSEKRPRSTPDLDRMLERHGTAFIVFWNMAPGENRPMPDARYPEVFRALYEAVDYARTLKTRGMSGGGGPMGRQRFYVGMYEGRGEDGYKVVWRSWDEHDPRRRRRR